MGQRYRSDHTNGQLWELVREAAKTFSPTRPDRLSTRKFDAARASLGHPDAPSGRWIAKRLGLPWPEVVKVAVDAKRDPTMTEAAAKRAPAERWLSIRHLHFALNFVARERGVRSFSEIDYIATREALLSSGATGARAATLPIILPTSGQLIQIVRRIEKAEAEAKAAADSPESESESKHGKKPKSGGKSKTPIHKRKKQPVLPELNDAEADAEALPAEIKHGYWNRALILAGLEPYETSKKARGTATVEAIHLYIEASGVLPATREELMRFARAAGFALSRLNDGDRIQRYLPHVAAHRATLGLAMPDEIGKAGAVAFDLTKVPGNLQKPMPDIGKWDDDDAVIDALCDYLDDAAARNVQKPTRADYIKRQRKARRGEWPSASTLGRRGEKSFTKWINRAQPEWQRRRKAKKAAA